MRDLVKLTDGQIEEAFENLGIGADVESVVFTKDTINDFIDAAKNYREHGTIEKEDKTLLIYNVQVKKGDMRNDLYVIDFGEVRGCFH